MDQIEEVSAELQSVKGENAIVVKLKEGFKETRVILTNQVNLICCKEFISHNLFYRTKFH